MINKKSLTDLQTDMIKKIAEHLGIDIDLELKQYNSIIQGNNLVNAECEDCKTKTQKIIRILREEKFETFVELECIFCRNRNMRYLRND